MDALKVRRERTQADFAKIFFNMSALISSGLNFCHATRGQHSRVTTNPSARQLFTISDLGEKQKTLGHISQREGLTSDRLELRALF
jgi:hypothetical protein